MISPPNGSTDHSDASAGTTSRCAWTSNAPRDRIRALDPGDQAGPAAAPIPVRPRRSRPPRAWRPRTRRHPARPRRCPGHRYWWCRCAADRGRGRRLRRQDSCPNSYPAPGNGRNAGADHLYAVLVCADRLYVVGHLAGRDRRGHPVLLRRQRAGPPVAVRATRVVRVIEVQPDPVTVDPQRPAERALDGVGQIAPAAVGALGTEVTTEAVPSRNGRNRPPPYALIHHRVSSP